MRLKRVRVYHTIRSPKIPRPLRLAVAADLHSEDFDDVMEDFRASDAILVPGDLVNRHRRSYAEAARFLREAPEAAPVFYSIGNHERKCAFREEWFRLVRESRVTLLDDADCLWEGIRLGGLSSRPKRGADTDFLDGNTVNYDSISIIKYHHPEVWRDAGRGRDIDFTVCGHAHGGQVQLFGRGLYAPGQGFFPKLTHGLHDGGRMILSRGMTNGSRLPRINDPLELIILNLEPGEETAR